MNIDYYNKLKNEINDLEIKKDNLYFDIKNKINNYNKFINYFLLISILLLDIFISYEIINMNNILIAKIYALILGNFAPFYFAIIIGDIIKLKFENKIKNISGYSELEDIIKSKKIELKKVLSKVKSDIPLINSYSIINSNKKYTLNKPFIRVRKK